MFHDHFFICENSLLRLLKITYIQFDQFLHPQQYLPQQVPCIARFFAQNVNPASINQSEGTSSNYWLVYAQQLPNGRISWTVQNSHLENSCQSLSDHCDSPHLTIICCLKSAPCLTRESFNGDSLDLPVNISKLYLLPRKLFTYYCYRHENRHR